MVGIAWTDKNVDLDFFVTRLPEFNKVHKLGQQRKKNPTKDAFLEKIYLEYEEEFPGRMAKYNLPSIGVGGEPADRKQRTLKVSCRYIS
jgi:hypothetical protein